MKRINAKTMDTFLDDTFTALKNHKTPSNKLGVCLNDNFYYKLGDAYWANYKKTHPGVKIEFMDHHNNFYLLADDGSLIREVASDVIYN